MAFLAVFAVVCLFSLFAPYSPEPRFGVGVSLPVSHAEIYRNWAIQRLHKKDLKCGEESESNFIPRKATGIMFEWNKI